MAELNAASDLKCFADAPGHSKELSILLISKMKKFEHHYQKNLNCAETAAENSADFLRRIAENLAKETDLLVSLPHGNNF